MARYSLSFFTLFTLLFVSSYIYPKNYEDCRWTSAPSCREKVLGSSCGNNGRCLIKEWLFSEAECECYKDSILADKAKNVCRWTSDRECRDQLPGKVARGECKIKSIPFGEPECVFIQN